MILREKKDGCNRYPETSRCQKKIKKGKCQFLNKELPSRRAIYGECKNAVKKYRQQQVY